MTNRMDEAAETVAGLLTSRSLCCSCIQMKTGFTRWELEEALRQLCNVIRTSHDRCAACRNPTTVAFTLA